MLDKPKLRNILQNKNKVMKSKETELSQIEGNKMFPGLDPGTKKKKTLMEKLVKSVV